MEQEFKAGVHTGISNEEYHGNEAVSRSDLKNVLKVPAGYIYGKETTGDMNFGNAAHTYVLENHLFDEMVIESENKTTTAKDYQNKVADNPGKYVVTAGSIELIEQLGEAIYKHPKAAELLSSGIVEPTIYWKDEETGLWCKTRPDKMCPDRRLFVDLKFMAEGKADPFKFRWAIRDFGYDYQAAWNTWGMKQATGITYPEFWFIVVEKEPPFKVACYKLDEEWVGDAMFECKTALHTIAECRKKNEWPNYTPNNIEGEELYKF